MNTLTPSRPPTLSPSPVIQNGQRVQALLAGHWHLAQFITYAVIDGREQAIVRTARTLGKPGLLSYLDIRDVRKVEFDPAGTPILGKDLNPQINTDFHRLNTGSESEICANRPQSVDHNSWYCFSVLGCNNFFQAGALASAISIVKTA